MEPFARDDRSEYPDLARIAATAARWWWLLLLGAAVGVALAVVAGGSSTPTYEASTRLLVGANGGDYSVLRAAGQQAETDVTLATSEPVLAAVRRRLGNAASVGQLRGAVSADADSATRVLTITAQSQSAVMAARIANAVATELDAQTRAGGGGGPSSELSVVDLARVPGSAESNSPRTLIVIAGLAGLLAALAIVVVLDLSRRLIATEDELAATVPAPFLGTVGRRRARLVGAATLLAEQRAQVVVAGVHDDGSAAQSAFALATALAAGGSHVALVDADTEAAGGSLTGWLAMDGRPGFTEALAGRKGRDDASSFDALLVGVAPRLEVLPRGRGELEQRADPEQVEGLIRRLAQRVDVVVVCAPVATGPSGAVSWAQLADGVVLALRRHHASRDELHRTVDVLQRAGARVIGTLMVQGRARRLGGRSPLTGREDARMHGDAEGAAPAGSRALADPVRQLGA